MKTLVTGGAGFIGSHIVDRLVQKKMEVVVVDNLSTGYKENINPKSKFYKANITDITLLKRIFKDENPAYVIHAAANIRVRESVENPMHDAKINITGSLNVLECCREFKIRKIAYLCTGGALYGNPEYLPADENHPINPISPYGISKRAVELYLQSYFIQNNLDFVSLRFSNVYGPRDNIKSGHVIPLFIYSLLNNKPPYITGDGSQGRDFIYVDDVVAAVMLSLIKAPKDKFLNIGSEKITSVNSLFEEIKSILKVQLKPRHIKERKGDVKQIYLDAEKAKKQLGWAAETNLRDGLIKTIKWFKEK